MKDLLTILFLAPTISLFSQSVKGIIIDGTKGGNISFANVQLLDSAAQNIKGEQRSDADGRFKFDKLNNSIYCIKISYVGYRDTTFRNINVSSDIELKFDIHKPCKYDISLNDKTCPICYKSDSVIKIVYGLLITEELIDKKTKKAIKSDWEPMIDFFPAGCMITSCDPNWYCKRDSTKF